MYSLSRIKHEAMTRIYQEEDRAVLALICPQDHRVLDVGCGQGRFLIPLVEAGHSVTGIDVNPHQVRDLRSQGYDVLTPDQLSPIADESVDAIIMSHILEHIAPSELIDFLDTYLDKLKVGGKLVVATPLMNPEFFDDYDHIRPYPWRALTLLYSDMPQYQRKPRHRLFFKKIWFRRWPFTRPLHPYRAGLARHFSLAADLGAIGLYRANSTLFGRVTGWAGVLEKTARSYS